MPGHIEWDSCGPSYTNENRTAGYVKSFPYKNYASCNWFVETGCDSVQYVIDEINTEYNSECAYDYLEVVSGNESDRRRF